MKAKQYIPAMAMAICAIGLTSCRIEKIMTVEAYGNLSTVEYSPSTGDFSCINVNGSADVVYTQGEPSVKVTIPEKLAGIIDVRNDGGCLRIDFPKDKSVHIKGNPEIKVECSSPQLVNVLMNGSGDFKTTSSRFSDITVTFNGSGDMEWENCTVDNLNISVNGAGDMDLKGISGKSITMEVSGAGDADMEHINMQKVDITVDGAGDISIDGKADKADIVINGAGSIDVSKLSCPSLSTANNGIGTIKR